MQAMSNQLIINKNTYRGSIASTCSRQSTVQFASGKHTESQRVCVSKETIIESQRWVKRKLTHKVWLW
jgi:hypothetical protein